MIIKNMYKVKEIFRSIQGEGFHSGKNAVFIRFFLGVTYGMELRNSEKKQFVIFVTLTL